jgi:hypothetical protein
MTIKKMFMPAQLKLRPFKSHRAHADLKVGSNQPDG